MKKIARFNFFPGKGYSLDLVDAPAAVRITPNDGTVVLHEGRGDGRLSHVAVPGDAVLGFRLETERIAQVYLTFRRKDQIEQHSIGSTDDPTAAQAWLAPVNAFYARNHATLVAELLNTLNYGTNPRSRADAAGKLAALRASEGIASLARFLAPNTNAWLRACSVLALGILRATTLTSALRELLVQDPKPPVRAAAANALGNLNAREAIDALVDRLEHDPSTEVRGEAAEALGRIGGGSMISHLVLRANEDGKAWVRRRSIHALRMSHTREALEALTGKLQEENPWVVEAAEEELTERST